MKSYLAKGTRQVWTSHVYAGNCFGDNNSAPAFSDSTQAGTTRRRRYLYYNMQNITHAFPYVLDRSISRGAAITRDELPTCSK